MTKKRKMILQYDSMIITLELTIPSKEKFAFSEAKVEAMMLSSAILEKMQQLKHGNPTIKGNLVRVSKL